ncbi:MAG TPA: SDR family oxidoreductase [Acidobacteriota bacterium]|nr:SDR family oxidoreductase [Acidobacteriota bacterium]
MSEFDPQNIFSLDGNRIVITGGTGVLCGEIALALVRAGARVAVLGRHPEKADKLLEQVREMPGELIALRADVLDRSSLEVAFRAVLEQLGGIDGLINGAGGNAPAATTSPDRSFFDILPDDFRAVSDVNLLGTVLPSQVFGKQMAEQGSGVIVNVSSMASLRPLTRIFAYSAAKSGVNNFTRWLAVHMAREYSPKIRVNAIAPGFFLTEQNRFLLWDEEKSAWSERGQAILDHTPAGRFGDPADLVGSIFWLLSPASSFVTGTVIPIDGGFSAFSGV